MSETKERPILFSGPMVRALIAGTKTQTRRVVKSPAKTMQREGMVVIKHRAPGDPWYRDHVWSMRGPTGVWGDYTHEPFLTLCPYGQPGDRLWVRETWASREDVDPSTDTEKARHYVRYRADGGALEDEWHSYVRWRSSIHMPRWASRLTLEVTGVRVERVQDISEEDARAEGVEDLDHFREAPDFDRAVCRECGGTRLHLALGPNLGVTEVDCSHCDTYRKRFRNLWHHINGAESWERNDWVWVVEFRRVA